MPIIHRQFFARSLGTKTTNVPWLERCKELDSLADWVAPDFARNPRHVSALAETPSFFEETNHD